MRMFCDTGTEKKIKATGKGRGQTSATQEQNNKNQEFPNILAYIWEFLIFVILFLGRGGLSPPFPCGFNFLLCSCVAKHPHFLILLSLSCFSFLRHPFINFFSPLSQFVPYRSI